MWIILVLAFLSSPTGGKRPPSLASKLKKADPPKPAAFTPDEGLGKARQESLQGNHSRVIFILRPLLYPTSKFSTESREIEALRLLGLSFWFKGDILNSEQAFSVLLNRRPNFILDPVVVPVGAIEFFNKIKKKMREKLIQIRKAKELEALRKKQAEEEARHKRLEEWKKNAPILVKSTVINKSFYVYNLFPFGIGQFQNGHDTKGWLVAGLQVTSAAISLSAYTYLMYRYPKGTVPGDEIKSAKQIQYLQFGSGVAFFALWLVSAVDAIAHFKPTRTEEFSSFAPRRGRGVNLFASPLEGGGIIGISGEF
ncbi:CCDC34 family protein [Myxococcota bacterium]|nr:CCDC34 family protein [Myxococcota bacterium]